VSADGTTFEGAELFVSFLREYHQQPDRRGVIVDEVNRLFEREASLLVVDTCGYTRALRRQGVVPFLAVLLRLNEIVTRRVADAGGSRCFREADNFFAMFPTAAAAATCGESILREVAEVNVGAAPEDRLAVSIGVGFGPLLVIGDGQVYGEEVNLTSKVGEDLAGPDELLLTAGARAALGESEARLDERRIVLSGLEIVAYRLRWQEPAGGAAGGGR
jgi:class 3 adenylate cyclase